MIQGHDWHYWKQCLLMWAGRSHHAVPHGFNVTVEHCGAPCDELLKAFQRARSLQVDGILGPATAASIHAFLRPPEPPPTTTPRDRYLGEWWWALTADTIYRQTHGRTAFSYLAARPYSDLAHWQRHEIPMAPYDCSSSTIAAAHRAGIPDPSGEGYNGLGNTQSMLDHLTHLASVAAGRPGDLIVFAGAMEDQHVVTIARQNGANPWVFSHGSPGIGHWPLSWEIPAHEGQPIVPLSLGIS